VAVIGVSGQRLVLVGGGHTHVQVLLGFAKHRLPSGTELCVVLDRPTSLYSGMVPGVVAGRYQPGEAEIDLLALSRRAGARVVLARCIGFELAERQVLVHDAAPVRYEILSIDVGAAVAAPPESSGSLPVWPARPIVRLVDELLAFAKVSPRGLTVAVVGAGTAGVELAFALHARLRSRHTKATVMLVERGPVLVPELPRAAQETLRRKASERGIGVVVECAVTRVTNRGLLCADRLTVPCDMVVWATEAEGLDWVRQSRLPLDTEGFIRVHSTLQVVGHDAVFASGDCASVSGFPRLPKSGVQAVRAGPVLGQNLRAQLSGKPLRRFAPERDALVLVNLADGTALASKWGRTATGPLAMWLKDAIDRRYVSQFHWN
jgi:selenide,water dikinase